MGRSRKCNWKRKALKANKKKQELRVKEINEIQSRIIKLNNGGFSYSAEDFMKLGLLMPKMHMIKKRRGGTAIVFESKEDQQIYEQIFVSKPRRIGFENIPKTMINRSDIDKGSYPVNPAKMVSIPFQIEPEKLRGGMPPHLKFIDNEGRFIDPDLGEMNFMDPEVLKKLYEDCTPKQLSDKINSMPLIFGTSGSDTLSAEQFKKMYEGDFIYQHNLIAGVDDYGQDNPELKMFSPSGYLNNFHSVLKDKEFEDEVKKRAKSIDLTLMPEIIKYQERNEKIKKELNNSLFKNPMARLSAENVMRRNRLDLMTIAERAIHNAIVEVEKVGADVKLTNSVTKLIEAKNELSDYIDNSTDQTNEVTRPLTFGEKAVGLSFNPSGNTSVNEIKRKFADVIDFLNDFRNDPNPAISGEAKRQASIAITEAQTSQMWAVKAITWVE